MTPVVDYVEGQLQKAASLRDMSDTDMISLLSGNGGSQVDLVFYLFSQSKCPGIHMAASTNFSRSKSC